MRWQLTTPASAARTDLAIDVAQDVRGVVGSRSLQISDGRGAVAYMSAIAKRCLCSHGPRARDTPNPVIHAVNNLSERWIGLTTLNNNGRHRGCEGLLSTWERPKDFLEVARSLSGNMHTACTMPCRSFEAQCGPQIQVDLPSQTSKLPH